MQWFLLLIGILLIVINFRALKKEKSSFSNIIRNEENDLEEFEVRLGEVRREFTETIFELQQEIEELKDKINSVTENSINKNNIHVENSEKYDKIEEKRPKGTSTRNKNKELPQQPKSNASNTDNKNSIRINEIQTLLNQGMGVDDIAETLNIGKGEVLLIKELYTK